MPDRDERPRRIPKRNAKPDDRPLVFSFQHLDLFTNPKFFFSNCSQEFLKDLLSQLQQASGIPVSNFKEWNHHTHRHAIAWEETTEPEGFIHLDTQLRLLEAWQFQVWPQKEGRVHGILVDEVFHIVWLDPFHKLYRLS